MLPGAMQSRAMSVVEATTNVAVGLAVAVATQILVFPLFGFRVGLGDNLALGVIFTAVSLARSYTLRRIFERLRVRSADREAAAPASDGREVGRGERDQSAMR